MHLSIAGGLSTRSRACGRVALAGLRPDVAHGFRAQGERLCVLRLWPADCPHGRCALQERWRLREPVIVRGCAGKRALWEPEVRTSQCWLAHLMYLHTVGSFDDHYK